MAKITKASIIPYISTRRKNGMGYYIELFPPIENFPGESLEEDVARINQLFEEQTCKAPEQYLWGSSSLQNTSEGMPKLYRTKPRQLKRKKASQPPVI